MNAFLLLNMFIYCTNIYILIVRVAPHAKSSFAPIVVFCGYLLLGIWACSLLNFGGSQ